MAINKTIFTADRAAQKSEILAWLQANAAEYFDSIETDTDGNIECSLENGAELLFMFDTSATIYKVMSKTGKSKYVYSGSAENAYTKAGIATSKGLMLISTATSSTDNIIIISKTNSGTTAISAFAKTSSGSASLPFHYFIDLNNDTDWIGTAQNILTYSVSVTSLAPVCFSSGNYCEHVFMTIFSQFTNNPCIMQINGKKYAYGGYLALEE